MHPDKVLIIEILLSNVKTPNYMHYITIETKNQYKKDMLCKI